MMNSTAVVRHRLGGKVKLSYCSILSPAADRRYELLWQPDA